MKLNSKGFVSLIILVVSVIIILIIVSIVLRKQSESNQLNKNPQDQVNDVRKQMEDINKTREKMYNQGNSP